MTEQIPFHKLNTGVCADSVGSLCLHVNCGMLKVGFAEKSVAWKRTA